jgi:hypothetical protein
VQGALSERCRAANQLGDQCWAPGAHQGNS